MKKNKWIGPIARIFYYSIIFLLLFFCAKTTFAASDHIMINEVYPNPVDVSDQMVLTKEWIELFNPTAIDIDYQTMN